MRTKKSARSLAAVGAETNVDKCHLNTPLGRAYQALEDQTDPSATVKFTLVTKSIGPLTKIIRYKNGKLIKDASECWLDDGTAQEIEVPFQCFAKDLRKRRHNQAIVHGICGHKEIKIVSERNFKGQPGTVTRTKKFFRYPKKNALTLFDYDVKPNVEPLSHDAWVKAMSEIFPGFEQVGYVVTPSTSSCIYGKDGNQLSGESSGFHHYVIAKKPSDIPRFNSTFFKRLWLAGYGYIFVSRSGAQLERTIYDQSVMSPERLDFVAGAVCRGGIEQRLPNPTYQAGDVLDTRLLPSLTQQEESEFKHMVEQAKQDKRDEADTIRNEYFKTEAPKIAKRLNVSQDEAREILSKRVCSTLSSNDILEFNNGGFVNVRDILKDPKKYHLKTLRDPLEPEQGKYKAKLFLNDDGSMIVNSYLHGGRTYRLQAENSTDEDEKSIGKKEKKTQSQILCELAEGLETFCTPDGDVYAFIPVNGHIELWPVRWQIFKQWLVKGFWDNFNKPPGGQAITDALNAIEAKAQFSGTPKREIFLRVAEHDGKFYLDLCNETWQVVEISADGWQVINVSPVPFKRPKGLLPLPEPNKSNKENFQALKKYINLKTEDDFILLVAWLVGALRKEGDHVILVLQGPEGTGKTTAARLVKTIIDPNISSERSAPRNEEDFIIGASNNHITSFDNISGIQPWLADALCRLSTGGGFSTRQLYTNDEEKLFYARRPAILTGINPMPNRNDLARRCIVLNLEPIRGQVLEEKSLFEKFRKEVLPGILGALCTAVSAALRNEKMEPKDLPCMASFTAWILRAEEALPWKPGAFKKAYKKNTKNIIEQAVDADLVSSAIQKFMADKESWRGTASELLEELCKIVLKKTQNQKAWPKEPNILSNKLKRASSFLRQVGIEVETGIKTTRGKRLIALYKGTKKTATIPTNATNDDSGDENKKDRHSHQVLENIEENKESCDQSGDQIKRPPLNKYLKILNKISKSGDSGDSGDEMPTLSKDMEVFEYEPTSTSTSSSYFFGLR
jgi:hypothetical protein